MSVINSMLRDLDRRHAPMPVASNVQPTLVQPRRVKPRSAIALCVLIVLVILSWSQHFKKPASENTLPPTVNKNSAQSVVKTPNVQTVKIEQVNLAQVIENSELTNRRSTFSLATTRHEPLPAPTALASHKGLAQGSESASMPPTVAANEEVNRLVSQKNPVDEIHANKKEIVDNPVTPVEVISKPKETTPIIKQQRKSVDDVAEERYQLARAALTQNQPQRAYELLRDNPPSLLSNTDYHAVLAAVEQQLGHYADANLRYQQLLSVDQNQSSWWLGLALSLEGEHRNKEALAAYRRAAQLNSLPEAAHQYVAARIAALNLSAEQ